AGATARGSASAASLTYGTRKAESGGSIATCGSSGSRIIGSDREAVSARRRAGARAARATSAPHLFRDLDDERELALLVVGREDVALGDAREAALRGEAQLLERDVSRRLVDAPLDLVLVLERSALRRDEAEHDLLAFRHEPQRLEAAGPLVVVLEEETVDIELVEEHVGDRLVPALGEPTALRVAAAQVNADGHVVRPAGDRIVDQPRVRARQRVDVLAALARAFAHLLVAEVREIRVVDLQVAASGRGEIRDLLSEHARDVREKLVHLGIHVRIDRSPSAAEVQHRGRRNRLPRRARRERLQEAEILHLDAAFGTIQLPGDDGDEGCLVVTRLVAARRKQLLELDALEAVEEVAVERLASILAVGDRLESERF